VLLHCVLGLGDTLHFVRSAPRRAARGATVVLEVQEGLKALLAQMPGVSAVIARGEPLPAFDLYCPLLSLPLALGTRLETIPANVPYIAADPARVAHWAAKLSDFSGKTKIGLVWAGNSSANAIDTRRSLRLSEFAPLAAIPGIHFFSLQKGEPAAQALHPPQGFPLADFSSELHGPAPWRNRSSSSRASTAAGAGSITARTVPGIRRPGCFISRRRVIGTRLSYACVRL
jgi:hypothetical protein